MGFFAIEILDHRETTFASGDIGYETRLYAIKYTLQKALDYCKHNPEFCGKERDWHWRITEYKEDCEPIEDQTLFAVHPKSRFGSFHVLPNGRYCTEDGKEIGGSAWENKDNNIDKQIESALEGLDAFSNQYFDTSGKIETTRRSLVNLKSLLK